MSTASARPWYGFALIGGVALVLLYFLSAPVVYFACLRHYSDSRGLSSSTESRRAGQLMNIADRYAAPYAWLEQHSPLRPMLRGYEKWSGECIMLAP